jgi:hypothetical protein
MPGGPMLFFYITMELQPDGTWKWARLGDCAAQYYASGLVTVEWMAKTRPRTSDRSITALVSDRCQPARLRGRLADPIMRVTPEAVLVIFTARFGGDTGDVCVDSQKPYKVTVELDEPLGDRALLDGALWPPRDATTPLGEFVR